LTSTLLVVGAGHMGSALVRALHAPNLAITVIDPHQKNRDALAHYCSAAYCVLPENAAALDTMLLAVKPQTFRASPMLFAPHMQQAHTVISIMAGVEIAELSAHAGHHRIVRIMPNLPVAVGAGMSVAAAHADVSKATRTYITQLFAPSGALQWLADETLFNAATAIAGCGPAYVFALIEALAHAAMQLGFDAKTAQLLARYTVQGAAHYAQATTATPTELMTQVASKGGVTEAALAVLMPRLKSLMTEVAQAAITRADAMTTTTGTV
jgi:pyrroline-5-carboxylate reductase